MGENQLILDCPMQQQKANRDSMPTSLKSTFLMPSGTIIQCIFTSNFFWFSPFLGAQKRIFPSQETFYQSSDCQGCPPPHHHCWQQHKHEHQSSS